MSPKDVEPDKQPCAALLFDIVLEGLGGAIHQEKSMQRKQIG